MDLMEKLTDEQKIEILKNHTTQTIESLKNSDPPRPRGFDLSTPEWNFFIATIEMKMRYTRVFEDIQRFLNDEPPLPPELPEEFRNRLDAEISWIVRKQQDEESLKKFNLKPSDVSE